MKRSGFKPRTKPMSRRGRFESSQPGALVEREPRKAGPEYRYGVAALLRAPIAKEEALQHAGYMAQVRRLPCARCGIVGLSQFCHSDEGKGTGIKTDCRRGWPGCGPHHDSPGCHWFVGTSGNMFKAARREFEEAAGRSTRAMIRAMGRWPASLPDWKED